MENPKPNAAVLNQGISIHPLFPKINPVTGEYLEEECDLIVAGCQELSARRFYNHRSYPSLLYGFWRLNPESFIKANFEKSGFPLNVIIGNEEGGGVLLDERLPTGYNFNPKSQTSQTNLSAGIPSGQTNPCNIQLSYHKIFDPKDNSRFVFAGTIADGAGKKTQFYTNMHKWHKSIVHKKGPFYDKKIYSLEPDRWIPYHCHIDKEELPNGNQLKYQYVKYFDDKYYPSQYRIAKITALNKKGEILGWLSFEYPEAKGNCTTAIKIIGSDNRTASCPFHYQKACSAEIVLPTRNIIKYAGEIFYLGESTSLCHPHISYRYDQNLRLDQTTRPEGRIFKTEYASDGKVHKQYAPVGPNDELVPIATFTYSPQKTYLRDGEGNLTCFTFNSLSRITDIEKFLKNDVLFFTEHYQWNDKGELIVKSVEDRNHHIPLKTQYIYDDKGNVLEEHFFGNFTGKSNDEHYVIYRTYSKDGYNLKLSENDGSDKLTVYQYQPNTNLLSAEFVYQKDKLKKRTFHEYDDSAICIKTILDDGTSKDPDDLSNVTFRKITEMIPQRTIPCYGLPRSILEKTIDAKGNEILLARIDYTYHPSGKILTESHYDSTNSLRYTISNAYDSQERLLSTVDPLGNKKTFTYDLNFNLLSEKGPKNLHKEWVYNKADRPILEKDTGLVTKKIYDKLGSVIKSVDPCGNSTEYQYDAIGHLIQIKYPDGGIQTREYDIFGNIIKETDPNGYETKREYNFRSQPTHITYPDGTKEFYNYYLNGTVKEHTDKNGIQTVYSYDVFDHPIKTETYVKGKLLKTTTATFSTFCKLSETDAEGILTTYTYDYSGRKRSEKKGEREVLYFYDELGRLHRTQMGDIFFIEEFDLLDRLVEKRTEDLFGTLLFKESYLYDEDGNKTHTITCEGTTETKYNAHHLPIQEIAPDGYVTSFNYSYQGSFAKTTIDPTGVKTIELYDLCRRLKEIQFQNPKGTLIQHREFAYDLDGHRTYTIEHIYENTLPTKTQINKWEYGPLGRIERLLESDQKETRYLYDDKGRLSTVIKPDETELYHSYDLLGRLSRLTSNKKDIDYIYTYDQRDHVIAINNLKRSYDIYGNLIEEKLENGLILKSTYDPYGKRTSLTYSDGTKVSYSYQGNQLFEVKCDDLTYTYKERNLSSNPTLIVLPKNLGTISFNYDKCLRLKEIRSPYFTALDYTYDPNGTLTHYLFVDPLGSVDSNYTYDDLSQLISEKDHSYVYDSLYNRITKDKKPYILNELSQITSDGAKEYRYDQNGNLIEVGDLKFSYDSLNRLSKVQKGKTIHEYIYDGLNRRITKKGSKSIHYLWDDKNEIGSNSELRILGEGQGAEIGAACFVIINGYTYIPIHDHRGSLVTLIYAKTAKPQETYRYTAYGEELTSNQLCPWRFLSKRTDSETGFSYFGRRYYNPSIGRWITPDPLGFEDGPNLYAYCQNNPLTAIDLYGEWAFWQNLWKGTWKALDFAFPACFDLARLQPNAPMWQRAGLSGLAVFEVGICLLPPAKVGFTLAERSIYQISTSAMGREAARRGASYSAQKTATLAAEKRIAQKTAQRVSREGVASLDKLSKAGEVMDRGGLTKAGRALDKHGVRPGSVFPKAMGNPASKNMQGQFHLDDILTHPKSYSKQNRFDGIDFYRPDGSGVRFYNDGTFRGFLEPNL